MSFWSTALEWPSAAFIHLVFHRSRGQEPVVRTKQVDVAPLRGKLASPFRLDEGDTHTIKDLLVPQMEPMLHSAAAQEKIMECFRCGTIPEDIYSAFLEQTARGDQIADKPMSSVVVRRDIWPYCSRHLDSPCRKAAMEARDEVLNEMHSLGHGAVLLL